MPPPLSHLLLSLPHLLRHITPIGCPRTHIKHELDPIHTYATTPCTYGCVDVVVPGEEERACVCVGVLRVGDGGGGAGERRDVFLSEILDRCEGHGHMHQYISRIRMHASLFVMASSCMLDVMRCYVHPRIPCTHPLPACMCMAQHAC